jgi:RNA polymerase-binding transcription factor DksA
MNHINNELYHERLRRRRDEIEMTREHLQKEQRVVDENKDWIDHAAYESRVDLLHRLTGWYLDEIARIDQALSRIAENKYGLCLACHQAIEPKRLDIAPEAAFCAGCQELREQVAEV